MLSGSVTLTGLSRRIGQKVQQGITGSILLMTRNCQAIVPTECLLRPVSKERPSLLGSVCVCIG